MIGPQSVDSIERGLRVGARASVQGGRHIGSKLVSCKDVAWWAVAASDHLAPLASRGVAAAHSTSNLKGIAPHELGEMPHTGQIVQCLKGSSCVDRWNIIG